MSLRVWVVVFQPLSWGTQGQREWEGEGGRQFRKCVLGRKRIVRGKGRRGEGKRRATEEGNCCTKKRKQELIVNEDGDRKTCGIEDKDASLW